MYKRSPYLVLKFSTLKQFACFINFMHAYSLHSCNFWVLSWLNALIVNRMDKSVS
jgi:hypothetical protein